MLISKLCEMMKQNEIKKLLVSLYFKHCIVIHLHKWVLHHCMIREREYDSVNNHINYNIYLKQIIKFINIKLIIF